MPLRLYRLSAFERSRLKLGAEGIAIVGRILEALEIYYGTNCDLEAARKIAPHFFYKQLRKPYYEAGIESRVRVIIYREGERGFAVLAGSHDDVRRFLARL